MTAPDGRPAESRCPRLRPDVPDALPHLAEHLDDLPGQGAVDSGQPEVGVGQGLGRLVEELVPGRGQHGEDGAPVGRVWAALDQVPLLQLVQGQRDGDVRYEVDGPAPSLRSASPISPPTRSPTDKPVKTFIPNGPGFCGP